MLGIEDPGSLAQVRLAVADNNDDNGINDGGACNSNDFF